jgi:hypothetical protein
VTWLKRLAAIIFWFALVHSAHAQSVIQSGNVTPTHLSCWTSGGVIQDCGSAFNPYASGIGAIGPVCSLSAGITGPYQQFCLQAGSGGGVLSIQNFGGATAGGISFTINGTPATFPTVVTPTVSGDLASFNNTIGTLIDSGIASSSILPNIDVWLLTGSSNTVGQGSSASAPIPPASALMFCNSGATNPGVTHLVDPVCSAVSASANWNANTGSMWPEFSLSYNRSVGIVQTAVSGSTQSTACDFGVGNGNWQVTGAGTNYTNAVAAINTALVAYAAAGYFPIFRGIIQTDLGVNDGAQIDASVSGCTQAAYTTAFNAMAANFRAATIGGRTYPRLPIYMTLVGTNSNASFPDSPGYLQVRQAQLSIVASDLNTQIVNVDALSFGARGLLQTNSVHPTQAGYNEWGAQIGASVLPFIPAVIPYVSYSANASAPTLPTAGTVLQITGVDNASTTVQTDSYGSAASTFLLRSAAGTGVTPTAIQNGSNIGIFAARGYGATGFGTRNVGALLFAATQNWTDTAQGTQACIYTTANGANTATCNLTIGQNGLISAGALTLTGTLTTNVTGSTQCLHVNTAGAISGTGSDCGSGGGGSITIGSTDITSGTNGRILYDNSGVVGEATVTGSLGSVVLSTSPSISGLTVTSSFTATGLVTNADLANSSVTYGTTAVALGASSTSIAGLTELSLTSAAGATVDWNADTYFGRSAAAALRLGQADAAAPVAQKLGVQNVVTGTSNTAGTDWTIAGSQGTGTGIGGNIKFQVAPAGTTGTSVNALTDAMQIYNTKFVNIGGNFAPDAMFVVNANTGVVSPGAQLGTLIHLIAADSTVGVFDFDAFTSLSIFQGRLAGGTRAAPTAATAASYIFNIQGQVYDGSTGYAGAADIGFKTISQTSTSDHSGQIIFRTVAVGATSLTQRMLIDQGVIIGAGTTDPGAGSALASGFLSIGSSTVPTASAGELVLAKISATGTAPTAGFLKFEAVAGTNAGSCKIIAYAGTSTTPVTIIDNVGSGC